MFNPDLTPISHKGDVACGILTHASSLKKSGGGIFLPVNTTITGFNRPQSQFLSVCDSSQINDYPDLDNLLHENNLINESAFRLFVAQNKYS
jgi:hypothetical protein